MSWKASFSQGILAFQASRLDEALVHFTKALEEDGGDVQHRVYDSRAAVYEKLGKPKEALRDAKAVIKLAQDQWQGYARAARLFLLARKLDASLTMVNMALDRIGPSNTIRHVELSKLRDEVTVAQRALEQAKRASQNHSVVLPVELLVEVLHMVIQDTPAELVTVLHVCRHWRNVIWHTPSLWRNLVLTHRSPIRKLSLWTERSKGRVLELHVRRSTNNHLDWPPTQLRDFRWDKLRTCTLENWDMIHYVKQLTSAPPALTDLEELVIGHEEYQTKMEPSLFPTLDNSKLRSLTFLRFEFSWRLASTHVKNLASLQVFGNSLDPEFFFPTLKANQTLESFMMYHPSSRWLPGPIASPLCFPQLTHVELGGYWATSVIENMVLPAVQVLQIHGAGGSLDRAFSRLTEGPRNLKQLVVGKCSITPSILTTFLRKTPSLIDLQLLKLSNVANYVVEALATPVVDAQATSASNPATEASGMLCPSLMHFNVSDSPDVKTGPLVRLVKSRLHALSSPVTDAEPSIACAKIMSLAFNGCDQVDADWIPWFRTNVESVSCIYNTKKKAAWKR
ncbi:F-box/TPR repeat protein pof3 [Hypsizygus marmoreus]|uniref:F-box/TPR repeat protein pof3 n=1 Tax=Hypsizygus marmoreus TaxID=39966 RepID=A0A369JEA0_HYPMA|nr:F-box/TPR repeat protein pof3 [Hypsizygus marmoreus]